MRGVDFHVHLENSPIDKVLEVARERGLKFGIVEHAGTEANQYADLLSNDAELRRYLVLLDGKPVFKGIQAEWTDWMTCFSTRPPSCNTRVRMLLRSTSNCLAMCSFTLATIVNVAVLAQLDYVLTDAMTFPGKDGQRVKLWTPDATQQVDMTDAQKFMDRYVDWHVEIMAREPIDILANTTWLPAGMLEHWELYWTPPRMQKVIDAALKYGIALEISSGLKLPKMPFLKLAKDAGAKFSFGSNGHYPNMAKLDYSFEMAKQLDLKPADMFTPAPDGLKAVQRRKG